MKKDKLYQLFKREFFKLVTIKMVVFFIISTMFVSLYSLYKFDSHKKRVNHIIQQREERFLSILLLNDQETKVVQGKRDL